MELFTVLCSCGDGSVFVSHMCVFGPQTYDKIEFKSRVTVNIKMSQDSVLYCEKHDSVAYRLCLIMCVCLSVPRIVVGEFWFLFLLYIAASLL